ncbi:caskin-2 isoform X2 [Copidosoma floridanum]|uniref:caskin-2 isoform X2 n=1 Tax=Copidosoma floridanum TaxID=29053 RepID=UPI0006C9BC94|nr:caskin-2 isoform X2 [Copidosoma floridanum]
MRRISVGGMSRPSKAVTQVKKVAPPAVPNDFRHSGSSFGSAGYASSEDGFLPPGSNPNGAPNPGMANQPVGGMPGHAGGTGPNQVDDANYGMPAGKSPGPMFTHPGFTFPSMVNKYAHAEDQGIDMTQSPGRDSPGSSGSGSGSRHSTASLDSGRASGYHLGGPRSAGALTSSPRCSISSLGSHPDRPTDLDLVHAWLTELQFEEYFTLFASAGYDLATITRMTPEDLTAIGIKKPNHRKQLKAEIDNLNVGDGLPEHIPGSLEEWLRLLRLEEYLGPLHQQGMRSVDDVTTLTWEDLEDIGIVRLGHQKKLLLAIKRIKDIKAGKRIQPLDLTKLPPHPGHTQEVVIQRGVPDLPSPDEDCSSPILRSFQRPADCAAQHTGGVASTGCVSSSSASNSSACNSSGGSSNTSVNSAVQQFGGASWRSMYAALPGGLDYGTVVARSGSSVAGHSRGKSLESLEDVPMGYPPSPAPQSQYPSILDWRPRSYDDGDLTPTNDHAIIIENIGGGTLPRPRHCLVRPRPVTKIQTAPQPTSQYKSLPRDFDNKYQLTYGHDSSPNLKRRPPSPPRRQSSRELGSASSVNSINSSTGDIVIDCSGPMPTASCDDHHLHSSRLVQPPPPPQPLHHQYQHHHHLQQHHMLAATQQQGQMISQTPPPPAQVGCSATGQLTRPPSSMSRSWGSVSANVPDDHELIASLAMQHRNGSDASFKSNSSTESDSLPFANENAGTIKQRAARAVQEYANSPSHMAAAQQQHHNHHNTSSSSASVANISSSGEPTDVLSDIGNMLTNLTNELDAMLEEEKRQGLNT